MKRVVVVFYLFIIISSLSSNDAFVTIAGGQIDLSEKNEYISIKNEELTIELKDNYYTVDIIYSFYNNGNTATLLTAFPQYKTIESLNDHYQINNFTIEYGDGTPIPYRFDPKITKLNEYQFVDGWFLKEISFIGKEITTIHISYNSIYGSYGGRDRATYLLGTGNSWLGPIGNLNLTIINNSDYWINKLMFDDIPSYKYSDVDDGVYKIEITQHEPKLIEEIDIIIQSKPTYADENVSFWDSYWLDSYTIETSDLRYLNKQQLRILRNAIYANRGYEFKSQDLSTFFSEQYWYEINENFTESMFNEIEKENIELIYNYEYLQKEKKIIDVVIRE